MDAVPNVGEFAGNAASDWDDDDGSDEFLFRRGDYLDTEDDGDRLLATYQALPEPVRTALAKPMVGDRISRFCLHSQGNQLLGSEDNVYTFNEPINHLARAVWLMGQAALGTFTNRHPRLAPT